MHPARANPQHAAEPAFSTKSAELNSAALGLFRKKKNSHNSVILWVNLIGQDTAGDEETIVIKPRYQESGPTITASSTMSEGGQARGTEKLLISIFCSGRQAGRPVQ